MPTPRFEATVRRLVQRHHDRLAEEIRRYREDAGLSRRAVAVAAGVDPAFLGRIEDRSERPSPETLVRIGLVLGADFSAHLYPNTGPTIRDRFAAPMLELLLGQLHPRWRPFTEVPVHRPSRGWIDVVLHEPRERIAVAGELQSELRRLEQLIRWQATKAESIPSWEGWQHLGEAPAISRLLLVRRTRATRTIASDFAAQLRVAYQAHPDDAVASLTGTAPWPGAALVWLAIDARGSRLVGGR
jgi:transcriptional regulator with XRE-family HTH domain